MAKKQTEPKKEVIAPAEADVTMETLPNDVVETAEQSETAETEPKKEVIAPAEVIEVKEKPVSKSENGRVLVNGTHAQVEVSPVTAKIMAKFKK